MPGLCVSVEEGGCGFDYRLSMAIPDNVLNCYCYVPNLLISGSNF